MVITASSVAPGAAAIQLDYLSSSQVAAQPPSWWQSVLGIAGFEALPAAQSGDSVPVAASLTPSLSGTGLIEVWRVAGPGAWLASGARAGGLRFRHGEELLFGALSIPEHGGAAESRALLQAAESAYESIFGLLNETGHRHLIRIWNYLPEINRVVGGDERYRHFNTARHLAFRKSGRATTGTVPAACALGSPAGSPISIYFLASRRAPKMIENPRQTSAYHYPPKFGKDRPIFSRACLWGDAHEATLFVSGTASIVGHETIHGGDVVAQTRETVANLRALLEEANRILGMARYSLDGLKIKVYVRRADDLPAVAATLAQLMRPAFAVYLQADVCREELLVEIEAVG